MPLTPLNKVYKKFPTVFAENLVALNSRRKLATRGLSACRDNPEICTAQSSATRPLQPVRISSLESLEDCEGCLFNRHSESWQDVVSDVESDSDISCSRNLGKECRKRESPHPGAEDSFSSTWEMLYRPKVSRTSPQTTASLDAVDLWEDSDSESETPRRETEYDLVNGVAINPRHTVDFAQLRRLASSHTSPRSGLRVRRVDLQREKNNLPLDNKADPRPPQEKVKGERSPGKSERDALQGMSSAKSRIRVSRKMKSLFPNPSPPASRIPVSTSGVPSRVKAPVAGVRLTAQMPEIDPKQTTGGLRRSSTATAATDTSDPPQSGLSRQLSTADAHRKINVDGSHVTCRFQLHNNNCAVTNTAIHPPPPNLKPPREIGTREGAEPSPTRKVKFNNFVTVQDGDTSKTDTLRNSSNSAWMYKQQYLKAGAL